jgi:disease resistance protein
VTHSALRAQDYLIEENVEGCCVYHSEAPIFHEGAKKWPCCRVSKMDFDDFISVPGCCTGKHEPVE